MGGPLGVVCRSLGLPRRGQERLSYEVYERQRLLNASLLHLGTVYLNLGRDHVVIGAKRTSPPKVYLALTSEAHLAKSTQ